MVNRAQTLSEIEDWFFKDYLPHWVSIGANADNDGRSIVNYWTPPLHVSTAGVQDYLLTDDEVCALLDKMQAPLKAAGYSHTHVLDRHITAYNGDAGSIDVIWSRCDGNDVEIERRAAHFEIHRRKGTWHIIAIAGSHTDKDKLSEIWATSD